MDPKTGKLASLLPAKNEPSKKCSFSSAIYLLIIFEFILKHCACEQRFSYPPETSQYDSIDEQILGESFWSISNQSNTETHLSSLQTPPLGPSINKLYNFANTIDGEDWRNVEQIERYSGASIEPVLSSGHYVQSPASELFSPILNFQQIEPVLSTASSSKYHPLSNSLPQKQLKQNSAETKDAFDSIENGSGGGWENLPFDDTTRILEEAATLAEYSSIQPTPSFSSDFEQLETASIGHQSNRAPVLMKRLPKLALTAGQVWSYFIPYDTFSDEDGNLRNLKTTVFIKDKDHNETANRGLDSNSSINSSQYFSWLQYDRNTQLLYGLPTENDSGRHGLVLVVSDRYGATSSEDIEIIVRQHPSVRAFAHEFIINNVEWDMGRFPSMVDALGEFMKRISSRIYSERPFEHLIIHHYVVSNQTLNSSDSIKGSGSHHNSSTPTYTNPFFTISWSNGSFPIHPCNLTQVERLAKPLVDLENADWSLEKSERLQLMPSQNLIAALQPEFRPQSVKINLRGSCESSDKLKEESIPSSDGADSGPKLRVKIGKLTWMLGEPIEFRIPSETFYADEGTLDTRDLQLSLHTIDGLIFDKDPKYSFLEFDQESQILYGLPFKLEDHAGQREIQLTARHPKSGSKAREVFIIDIEAPDLTTVNNRAFKMSLYMVPRTNEFGPRDRVFLSHKVVGALRTGITSFHHTRDNPELVVMNIQKFSLSPFSRVQPDAPSLNGKSTDSTGSNEPYFSRDNFAQGQANSFYRYTWTNETIGYQGNCPVEVIRENILRALEQTMLELKSTDAPISDDSSKNDSIRFYDRLRAHFLPESDLIHLRFEPLGACVSALELHDVGNSDIADQTDRFGDSLDSVQEVSTLGTVVTTLASQQEVEPNNDEYWSIVVLIVLVVALIFVVVVFFMGMHTYKMNQDKRFELQVRLAQARQNSMYLSSILLANQNVPNGLLTQVRPSDSQKTAPTPLDADRESRKPLILDTEKQMIGGKHLYPLDMKPTSVQLSGQTVQTTPLRPNTTFTLDSIANVWHHPSTLNLNQSPSFMLYPSNDERKRSVTLNRRPNNSSRGLGSNQMLPSSLNHSQSIMSVVHQTKAPNQVHHIPILYSNSSVPVERIDGSSLYSSASSQLRSHMRPTPFQLANGLAQGFNPPIMASGNLIVDYNSPIKAQTQRTMDANGLVNVAPRNKFRSPSYSPSSSITNQSVITNPNFAPPH